MVRFGVGVFEVMTAHPVLLPGESQGRGAWRAAVYGVAQSRARLKRLSSSSSRSSPICVTRGVSNQHDQMIMILHKVKVAKTGAKMAFGYLACQKPRLKPNPYRISVKCHQKLNFIASLFFI